MARCRPKRDTVGLFVRRFRCSGSEFLETRIVPERIEHWIEPEQRGSKRRNLSEKLIAIVSARARRRFSRSADRRGAGPRRAAVLGRRSSALAPRREHAVQFPIAAKLTPSRLPTPRL